MKRDVGITSVLRRYCVGAALIVLAGCNAPPGPSANVDLGYRNPTALMGGTSRFDAGKFAGDWITISCLGICAARERYAAATDGVYLRTADGVVTDYIVTAPGVLRAQGSTDRLVVMWVDIGFRTAVIGDADGRWAAIIDRGTPSADRTAAAREILDFNGWDVSRLTKVTK